MGSWLQGSAKASWWGWGEAVLITTLALGLGRYLNPSDPFSVHASFPWMWFAPVLVALRYGMAPGLFSAAILVAAFMLALEAGLHDMPIPKMFFVGGLMLTMLCGEYGSLWTGRIRRAKQFSDYAEERLEQVSRTYYITRLSHDRLEQNLISKPITLRGALADLRTLLASQGGRLDAVSAGRFLGLLAHYCNLQSAALYLFENKVLSRDPVAIIGQGATLMPDDVLLRRCLENGVTAYHAVNELGAGMQSRYLVAAPFRVSDGRLLGVLLVEDMPFLALNRESLQVLSVLLGYFSDEFHAGNVAAGLLEKFPGCPPSFAQELLKLSRLQRDLDIDSALVALHVEPHPRQQDLLLHLQRMQRGLDFLWHSRRGERDLLVTLMPFAGTSAVEGYLARLETVLRQDFGISLGNGPVAAHFGLLSAQAPEQALETLLEAGDVR